MHADGERRGIWDLPPLPLGLLLALGSLYGQAGRTEDARAILERAIFQARNAGLVWFLSGATHELGKVEFMAGNLADAAENMRAAYALIETAEDQVTKPAIAAELACVLALEGHVQEAEELALAARAMSTSGFFAETCWRRALALVAAHESRFEEAIRLSEGSHGAGERLGFAHVSWPDARGGGHRSSIRRGRGACDGSPDRGTRPVRTKGQCRRCRARTAGARMTRPLDDFVTTYF